MWSDDLVRVIIQAAEFSVVSVANVSFKQTNLLSEPSERNHFK